MRINRDIRILVVDDSATVRKLMRLYLSQLGFRSVEDACDGVEAIARMRAKTFDLILSDWNMAPVNGLELLRHVRRDPRLAKTAFVMATSLGDRKFADVARENGATHYLVKPFTVAQLGERIESSVRATNPRLASLMVA